MQRCAVDEYEVGRLLRWGGGGGGGGGRPAAFDSLSLQNGHVAGSAACYEDSLSLRSLDAHMQNWSPLMSEIRPRITAKRKLDSSPESDVSVGGVDVPASKRPRTPQPDVAEATQQEQVGGSSWEPVVSALLRVVLLGLVCTVILASLLVCYAAMKSYQCSLRLHLPLNIQDIEDNLKRELFGQHIATEEIIKALGAFAAEERQGGTSPLLVLILTGWLGSGKSHAARLVASAFPVQANVHTIVGSYLLEGTASLPDLQSILLRSCGYSLLLVDDVDALDESTQARLGRMLVSLASEEGGRSNGTVVILTSSTGGHTINRMMLELGRESLKRVEEVRGEEVREFLARESTTTTIPLTSFLSDYNVPVEVIPFLPLTREHVRQCVAAELRRNGASMKSSSINSLLDQVQFFSQEFPIFAKTGCKQISTKVNLALGGAAEL